MSLALRTRWGRFLPLCILLAFLLVPSQAQDKICGYSDENCSRDEVCFEGCTRVSSTSAYEYAYENPVLNYKSYSTDNCTESSLLKSTAVISDLEKGKCTHYLTGYVLISQGERHAARLFTFVMGTLGFVVALHGFL
uniref:Transmembrane protein n=1 Tax=Chromera velia CCMP2878 TaxID=1169474 RepID=A0A0G4GK32_9ALVE|eukprot:Cvel_22249.t1-p1 / transcript=Cvel_22249.t1 / gene=Cvel_22249 / organism=Chromera_velia_CCMP2878 / gene_product=hypothetical protein / transcript_product=hypothetical protein / location=Cvel_scaffold2167:31309-31716(-) / protein_length=136 / sequence_SO=supercontig / SO=protein_coding / is_pseudo=false